MIPIANPDVGSAESAAAGEVINSGMIADGERVREFESEFAEYCGSEHGVATSNGTTALHAAIEALSLGEGDKIVTTPFSFIASSNAIRLAGAEPIFAEINPKTFNLSPESVREVVERHDVEAILTVHLYGLPSDVGELQSIADEYDIYLIEDCAQAHGSSYRGQRVGSFGDVACFSFYPTKNMTTGEGGMVTTSDSDLSERIRSFVNHGRPPEGGYEHVRVGQNYRMTSIAAAIGKVQLDKLPRYIEQRRANGERFSSEIQNRLVRTPTVPNRRTHAYHQYTLLTENRDEFADFLRAEGVGAKVYYPKCIHQQPAYESYSPDVPVAEWISSRVISIPVHPELTEEEVTNIIDAVNRYNHD
jgi:dTDP-4-amino-4,6-dideoxygalactose transaminase